MALVVVGNKNLDEITSEEVIKRNLVFIGVPLIMIRAVSPGFTGDSYLAAPKEEEVPDGAIAYVMGEVIVKRRRLGWPREVYIPVQFYKRKD